MSDRTTIDHWNVLAVELGAVPAAELEEEQENTPELPPSSDLSCSDLADEEPAEPSSGKDVAEAVEPSVETPVGQAPEDASPLAAVTEALEQPVGWAVEPEGLAKRASEAGPVKAAGAKPPVSQTASPQTVLPKRKLAQHWWDLATSLGVEVSEPETELESEPEPEVQSEPEPIHEVKADESLATRVPAESPARSSASARQPAEPLSREPAEPRRGHRHSSSFDDPDLSLDTPGVLDAAFDEGEPESVSHPETAPARRQPDDWAEQRRRSRPTSPAARDSIFFDEPEDEAFDDVESESEETAAAIDADEPESEEETERSGRGRGRRRRRGSRRGQRAAPEEVRFEPDSADEEEEEEEDQDDRSVGPRRRSGTAETRQRRAHAEDDLEGDLEDEGEDHFDDDEDEGGGERLRLKHKRIPTWQQAVDAILATNMESRTKNPGGGAGRGRGRRWRR